METATKAIFTAEEAFGAVRVYGSIIALGLVVFVCVKVYKHFKSCFSNPYWDYHDSY